MFKNKEVRKIKHVSVSLYYYCLILSTCAMATDDDIIAQDGYPLQSEGRTPGDEDSSGVDRGHSEVNDGLQKACKTMIILAL